MKRSFAIVLILAITLAFFLGCGGGSTTSGGGSTNEGGGNSTALVEGGSKATTRDRHN